jgi:hypothetical protein
MLTSRLALQAVWLELSASFYMTASETHEQAGWVWIFTLFCVNVGAAIFTTDPATAAFLYCFSLSMVGTLLIQWGCTFVWLRRAIKGATSKIDDEWIRQYVADLKDEEPENGQS